MVAVDRWLERMALNLHRRPLGLSVYDGSGERCFSRPSCPVVSWGLEYVFDFSRPFPYNGAQGGGRYGPGDSAL